MSEKVNMGLQLFPPPPTKKAAGKFSVRRNVVQADHGSESAGRATSPDIPEGRRSAMSNRHSIIDGRQSAMDGRQSAIGQSSIGQYPIGQSSMDGRQSALDGRMSPNTMMSCPAPFGSEIPRSHTSFSEAPTLVRSYSNASHSSIAKPRFASDNAGPSTGEPMIRSIFPRYNPEVPLERQQYFPTQASPTHIPRQVISKPQYSSGSGNMRSPLSAPPTVCSFPRGIQDVPVTPNPSSTEELKQLWKVTNGWKVSNSEGRSFCLKMTSAVDTPVHTLSSASQPFYTLRLDPTSTSALLTMTRQDPNKSPVKEGSSPKLGSKSSSSLEVLTTTLEEVQRRHAPNDGLVALLYPKAAASMAIDIASKPNTDHEQVMAAAEHECGRLVWDDDTNLYYLVHPATTTPFCVQINSSPAWSRVEYVLEHPQLPQNLVKLTRDGSGGGFLEVDTGVAARIDAFYLVDVAICAIMIVALAEEKVRNVERFEAPPVATPMSPRGSTIRGKKTKIEAMEVDLESQNSYIEKKSNLPKPTKGVLKVLYLAFRFVIWVLTVTVNIAAKLIICVSGCLTKK